MDNLESIPDIREIVDTPNLVATFDFLLFRALHDPLPSSRQEARKVLRALSHGYFTGGFSADNQKFLVGKDGKIFYVSAEAENAKYFREPAHNFQ